MIGWTYNLTVAVFIVAVTLIALQAFGVVHLSPFS